MSETPFTDQYFGTSPPPISRRLCEKAAQQNDELTRAERWLLLCQGVAEGQFLADPASRTDENVNSALGRPPPETLAENIKLTFGGGRTSIAEVVRDYWDPDRTEQLSFWAHECATLCWWTLHTGATYLRPPAADVSKAVGDAASVLAAKLRPQEMALEDAITARYCGDMPRPRPVTSEAYGGDVFAMQEASKTNEEWWVAADEWKHKREAEEDALRKQLRKKVDDELSRADKADLVAVRQLRERMDVETAEEAEQDAAIARAKAEEEAREEEQYQAERARKRRAKAEREEQQRKKKKREDDDDNDEAGGSAADDSDSESSGSGVSLENMFEVMRRHPPTRERAAAWDRENRENADYYQGIRGPDRW